MSVRAPRVVGRYSLFGEIASGGMATVCFGRATGEHGFVRTVAVKCLHASLAKERDFVDMFVDEARLASRIQHPNVVQTLDVVETDDGQILVVMEYLPGESLSRLHREARKRGQRIPIEIACAIVGATLEGLHAAHEAKSDKGEPLGIVHRDVSPQNVLVGVDGVPRVLDFGIAKAAGRLHQTRDGKVKGKLAYMSPEQMRGEGVDRRTDVYAAGVVLWELLTGKGLFHAEDDRATYAKVMAGAKEAPSALVPAVSRALDSIVMKALERDPARRWKDAREMSAALEDAAGVVSARRLGEWTRSVAEAALARRAEEVRAIESETADSRSPPPARASGRGSLASVPAEASTVPKVHVTAAGSGASELRLTVLVAAGAFVVAGGIALAIGLSRLPKRAAVPEASAAAARGAPSTPAPVQVPSATNGPEVAPPPSTAPVPTAPSASVSAKPRAVPRKVDAPCNPPWTIGPDGIKRFKPGCL